jgi:coenzyme F420-reducing hydrogenase alpha subunit
MREDLVMEKALADYILAQHAEADEFMKTPGNFMGKMPAPTETKYWSERVPSGTLAEFKRIELEEDAYYSTAEAFSKGYARSFDYSVMTRAELLAMCDEASKVIEMEAQEEQMREEAEQNHFDSLASDLNVDRDTLDRWMGSA